VGTELSLLYTLFFADFTEGNRRSLQGGQRFLKESYRRRKKHSLPVGNDKDPQDLDGPCRLRIQILDSIHYHGVDSIVADTQQALSA
jgi:hypothetical protein